MKYLDKLTTAFLVVLFAFAGLDKLGHYHGFVNAINSYKILPIPVGSFLAPLVIAAELSISLGLLVTAWRRVAALQAALLMTLLTIGLVTNHLLGSRGICGCWFSINMAQGQAHFALNGIIIIMSVLLWHAEGVKAKEIQDL